jgi:TetR/AcrR family transcriptional repressor of lmrAB and yxaGH operons
MDAIASVREDDRAVGRKKRKGLEAASKRAPAALPRTRRSGQHEAPRREPARGNAREQPDEGTRDRMVAGAARLLAERGLQATSFSEVLELTASPRGSVYHHFPDGKDQLVKAALDRVTAQMGQFFSPKEGAPPEKITDLFLSIWRGVLLRSQFRAGCAVVAVTVAADSRELLEHTAGIFRAWRGRLAELLVSGGLAPGDAARFAATLIAASEGAVVLSRAEQSIEPFDLVAAELLDHVRSLARKD